MRSSLGVRIIATVAALAPVAGAAVASADVNKPLWQASQNGYLNRVAPADSPATPDLKASQLKEYARKNAEAAKAHLGYPPAARALARREALANKTGESPRTIARTKQGMPSVQHARLLVLPVEFNPHANDDFSGFARYDANDPSGCVTEPAGTVFNGPLHNQIPNPANAAAQGQQHAVGAGLQPGLLQQDHLLEAGHHQAGAHLTSTGGVEPRRACTMHNFYQEMSKGRVRPRPASVTNLDPGAALGGVVLGRHLRRPALPERPGPPGQPARRRPDRRRRARRRSPRRSRTSPGPTTTSRTSSDVDDDGNLFEPDGIIDHVVLVHAGSDQSGGGGAQGTYALWAVSESSTRPPAATRSPAPTATRCPTSSTSRRTPRPASSPTSSATTSACRTSTTPSAATDPDIDFWDLMSSGSHSRPAQRHRCPRTWAPGASTSSAGSTRRSSTTAAARPPSRSARRAHRRRAPRTAVRVNLPDKKVTLARPHSGANAWWSNNDQDWATSA